MKTIIITESFHIKEFEKYYNEEEITLSFHFDLDKNKLVKNFKDWDFLKKFKKLKLLELNEAEIKETSFNFFSNLYSIPKLEKFIIDDLSIIFLPKKELPKNLYPKNLKEYKIKFNLKYFTSNPYVAKQYKGKYCQNYEGIGDEEDMQNTYAWFTEWLPQIYDFPNIKKFKKLQVLNFYNIFDSDSYQGHLFTVLDSLFYKKIETTKLLLKQANINKINIYGLNLKNEQIYINTEAFYYKNEKSYSFNLLDSEIFKSLAELYSTKKVPINNEDPLGYLKKYYKCKNLKEVLELSKSAGVPKGVRDFHT